MKVTMNLKLKQLLLHTTALRQVLPLYLAKPYQPYWLVPPPEPELVITSRREAQVAYGGETPPAKSAKGR